MPRETPSIIERRKRVRELWGQGLTEQQIADALAGFGGKASWHWRTVQDDIRFLRTTLDTPDFFQEMYAKATRCVDELAEVRDEAKKLRDGTDDLNIKAKMMRIIIDVSKAIMDKYIPSQMINRNIGDQKIEVSWAGEELDMPLCTRCGQKHYPQANCIIDVTSG